MSTSELAPHQKLLTAPEKIEWQVTLSDSERERLTLFFRKEAARRQKLLDDEALELKKRERAQAKYNEAAEAAAEMCQPGEDDEHPPIRANYGGLRLPIKRIRKK